MDFDNFDERIFSPEQTSLSRFLKAVGILLVLTFVIPIDRSSAGTAINVWDRFGMVGMLDLIRLMLPAVVGLGFVYLGFFARMDLKLRAGITSGLLLALVLVGINPLGIFEVVVPPISGRRGEMLLGMVDGEYFPREDVMHIIFLSLGLIGLGVGGRYRNLLHSSRIGSFIMIGGSVFILAYYLVPYDGGDIPAKRNAELYHDTHELATKMRNQITEFEGAMTAEQLRDPQMKHMLKSSKMVGQIKLSAMYFAIIYFIPVVLLLAGIPGWLRSRYRGHRVVFAKMAGWGASIYLVAFLFPLLAKEAMRKTGPGFWPAFRDFILFAAVFIGLTIALSSFLRAVIDGNKDDEGLPADPLGWKN